MQYCSPSDDVEANRVKRQPKCYPTDYSTWIYGRKMPYTQEKEEIEGEIYPNDEINHAKDQSIEIVKVWFNLVQSNFSGNIISLALCQILQYLFVSSWETLAIFLLLFDFFGKTHLYRFVATYRMIIDYPCYNSTPNS